MSPASTSRSSYFVPSISVSPTRAEAALAVQVPMKKDPMK
jgi:hypothetical protein